MVPTNIIKRIDKEGGSGLLFEFSSAFMMYKCTNSCAIEHLKMHQKAWENDLSKQNLPMHVISREAPQAMHPYIS